MGHFSIYLFGVTIAIGAIFGIFIALKESKRKGLDENKITDFIFYLLIVSIIGARLYYILAFNLRYYLKNPFEIFSISSGGMSIQGALISGILFSLWYTKRKKLSFLKIADAFSPAIAIGQAIGRMGCDVYGVPMKRIYFWGVNVNSQILHPAQMYEMILDLILFGYLWTRRGKLKYNGQNFIHYLIGFSINRAIVEFFRSNPIVIYPFTIAHVTSFAIIFITVVVSLKIKNISNIDEQEPSQAVKASMLEYVMIILVAIVGLWIYYSINR
ncbi:Prolipoprotein diacylglyceryl transferase [Caloramator australicus RC3]|uniref:Phosphatidylglycerol--prolipoprotein diacylglyceryl transferase n=1 Tax=Caloramator australicus RC3 TaxID=857293 RepID=I7LKI3_9CLOT|nr:Prolipoprotein diacylglyceryl transferase [Caloramator australicus RC3]